MWYSKFVTSSKHTSVIIALCLSKTDAKRIALKANDVYSKEDKLEPIDNLHNVSARKPHPFMGGGGIAVTRYTKNNSKTRKTNKSCRI